MKRQQSLGGGAERAYPLKGKGAILNRGFTLAEVLITLGIIGVVAALTLPALINKYQKVQYVTGLQKAYTVFNNGIKLLMADTGCDDIKCTGLFEGSVEDSDFNDNMEKMVRKYFKVAKVCKYGNDSCAIMRHYLDGNESVVDFTNVFSFVTTDGITYRVDPIEASSPKEEGVSKIKYLLAVDIDINSNKKPNVIGRDIFYFRLAQDGVLYPYQGEEYAKYFGGASWQTTGHYWNLNSGISCNPLKGSSGSGCAARIMENGWKMDY